MVKIVYEEEDRFRNIKPEKKKWYNPLKDLVVFNRNQLSKNRKKREIFNDCINQWQTMSREDKESWNSAKARNPGSGYSIFLDNCMNDFCTEKKVIKQVTELPYIKMGNSEVRYDEAMECLVFRRKFNMKRDLKNFPEGIYLGEQMQRAFMEGESKARSKKSGREGTLKKIDKEIEKEINRLTGLDDYRWAMHFKYERKGKVEALKWIKRKVIKLMDLKED